MVITINSYKAVCEVSASPSKVFELVVIRPGTSGGGDGTAKKRIQKNIKVFPL